MVRVRGDESVHVGGGKIAREALGDALERLAQFRPQRFDLPVIMLQRIAKLPEALAIAGIGDALLEKREEVFFLVVVVIGRRYEEIAQHRLGRGARLGVDATRVQVRAEALEGVELLLDATVASQQHLEGIVEPHRGIEKARARVPFHNLATVARGEGSAGTFPSAPSPSSSSPP